MQHCFIITSAINTRFGVYSAAERLLQTVITIRSIKQKVPTAKIILVEMAGLPLSNQQTATLVSEVDVLLDFTDDAAVKSMYTSTDNWDIVKNGTEIMVFGAALKLLTSDGEFAGIDRIHKISGRYVINDMFDPTTYAQSSVIDKIVVAKRRASQFQEHVTAQRWQYMSRLWSWPSSMTTAIIATYEQMVNNFTTTIGQGQYIDIEHSLFKYLPFDNTVHELDTIGVEGLIGPNGQAVKD